MRTSEPAKVFQIKVTLNAIRPPIWRRILFAAWWYRVNWIIAYSYDIFGDELPDQFAPKVASLLRALPVDEPKLFDPSFARREHC
jgi:hypothetical protein